jgi:hypothetical protein
VPRGRPRLGPVAGSASVTMGMAGACRSGSAEAFDGAVKTADQKANCNTNNLRPKGLCCDLVVAMPVLLWRITRPSFL